MKPFPLILILTLTVSSCSNYYYPTYQNIPTQTEKNELKASWHADLATGGLNASYTLTNHLGVMTNYSSTGPDTETINGATITHGKNSYLTDFGAFYYGNALYHIDDYIINMTYALTGAYSFGAQRHYHEVFDMEIDRFYLQPSVAFTSKFIDFGISSRFTYVDYTLNSHAHFNRSEYDLFNIENENFYFFEPQLFVKIGYKWFKIGYYQNRAFNLTNNKIEFEDHTTAGIVLTLQFKLNKLFNK